MKDKIPKTLNKLSIIAENRLELSKFKGIKGQTLFNSKIFIINILTISLLAILDVIPKINKTFVRFMSA